CQRSRASAGYPAFARLDHVPGATRCAVRSHVPEEKQAAGTRLRGEPVLVYQPAEQVASAYPIKVDDVGLCLLAGRMLAERWPLSECPVRPVLVVVPGVGREDVLEVAAADDQDPVETLAPDAADPAFGVCPRLRCSHGRLDHADASRAEDLV